jgi:osmoprotectant transport system permease protein
VDDQGAAVTVLAGAVLGSITPFTMGNVVRWFTDGEHWHGPGGIPHRLVEHLLMSGASLGTAIVVAVPVAVWLGHIGKGGTLATNVANVGRAVPSFAILVLGFQLLGHHLLFGLGALPTYFALVALAIPPMITNTYTGMQAVDRDVKEAAQGMGMTGWQLLRRVELPLAVPLVMAGVRTAGVQVVATATLAAVVAWGGLGRFIVDGFGQQDTVQLFCGAVMVALLSLLTELGLGAAQRALTPGSVHFGGRTARRVSTLPGAAAAPEAA